MEPSVKEDVRAISTRSECIELVLQQAERVEGAAERIQRAAGDVDLGEQAAAISLAEWCGACSDSSLCGRCKAVGERKVGEDAARVAC